MMGVPFPSEEWVKKYKEAVNSNPAYKEAAKDWVHGPVALIVKAEPSVGINEDIGVWLDLEKGVCKEAKVVSPEEARKAPFCIEGEYARWKQVLKKELDPVQGMMQGKLKLNGDLPTIVRFVRAAQELVNSATTIDTEFPDEK